MSFDCVTAFKSCLGAETLSALSSAGERLSLEQHFLGYLGVKIAPLSGEEKKTCCFLTLSYCCFNCDFQYVMIVCEGKWRTSQQAQPCTVNTVTTDSLQVVLVFAWAWHMVLYTLVSNVPCAVFFFLRGGGGGGVVPQLQMWNFNLTFSVVTLTPMSKCGWLNLLERWLFLQERGVLLTLVYLSPPNPSLHIHWRSQSVAMWQLFLDQNNYVQSY